MLITNTDRALLRLGLQFFASDEGAGSASEGTGGTAGGAGGAAEGAGSASEGAGGAAKADGDALDKVIQSKVDRLMAEERKKNAELQKRYDSLLKKSMSDEEVKKLEDEEREKRIAAKERDLKDRENKLYAIKAIKEVGLDDGSDKSLDLVDLIIHDEEKTMDARAKTLSDLVKRLVSAEVDKTFKANGRDPHGAKGTGKAEGKDVSIAEKLGKRTAESNAQTNEILKHYLGG